MSTGLGIRYFVTTACPGHWIVLVSQPVNLIYLFIYLFVVLNRTWGSVTGVGPEIGESNTVGKSKYRNVQRKGRAIAKR